MVTSDRISAFDVVMDEPVPSKGRVLTAMTAFWLDQLEDVAGSHLISTSLDDLAGGGAREPSGPARVMLCHRAEMLPVECIVRGYLSGSAWKEYRAAGTMHGTALPDGLQESDQLPEPVFTPSTKAEIGDHDENISFERAVELVGQDDRRARPGHQPRAVPAGRRHGPPSAASSSPTPSSSSASSTASSSCATRCSRPTRRGSGRPTSGSRAPRRRASTSSRCATTSTTSTGTRSRRRRRLPAEVVDRVGEPLPRGLRAHHRSCRSTDWPGRV